MKSSFPEIKELSKHLEILNKRLDSEHVTDEVIKQRIRSLISQSEQGCGITVKAIQEANLAASADRKAAAEGRKEV